MRRRTVLASGLAALTVATIPARRLRAGDTGDVATIGLDVKRQVVMYSSHRTPKQSQLFIANGDGSGERPLLAATGLDYSPSISPDGEWVIFTSERAGSADIYRIHLDGSGLERLTDDPAYDDQGALSPDGKTLAFVSSRGTGRAHIWLLDLASRRARLLTPNSGSDFRPAWSPDGKWIAFSTDRDSNAGHEPGHWELLQSLSVYVVRPDGSDLRRVTRGRGVAGSPRWSSDGKRIFYYETTELGAYHAALGSGSTQIVSIDVAEGSVIQHSTGDGIRLAAHPLPHGALGYLATLKDGSVIQFVQNDGSTSDSQPGDIHGASWSTDGKQVAYCRFMQADSPEVLPAFFREPGFRLVRLAGWMFFAAISPQGDQIAVTTGKRFESLSLMKPDGSDRKVVFTNKDGFALAPSWSADGKRIAFSQGMYFRFGHPQGQVSLINPDGTGLEPVSVDGTNSGFPSWSPDGQKIVYEQDGHLVVFTIATHHRTNLTGPGAQRDNFPKWSPRGDWIVFTSDRDGDEQFRIYLIRPDGTDLHKLTDSPGDAHATWSPDGKAVVFASARMGFKDERALSTGPQPYGDIFVIQIDGRGLRQLTDNQWEDGTPIWFVER